MVLEVPFWSPGGGGRRCGCGQRTTDWTGAVRDSGMLVVSLDLMGSRWAAQVLSVGRFVEDCYHDGKVLGSLIL